MPRRFLKHFFAILAILVVAGCSGGGCGGCTGCGVTPLTEGFPTEARVENAGSVRLTQSGVTFLQDNLGTLVKAALGNMGSGGVITFPIPQSTTTTTILFFDCDITVCPGGPNPGAPTPKCTAEIDIGNANLDIVTKGPHNVVVSGPLPLRLQDLPIDTCLGSMKATMNGNSKCPGENQTYALVDLTVDISLELELKPGPMKGFTKVDIVNLTINQNQLENQTHFNCGGFLSDVIDFVKGLVFGQFVGPLLDTLQSEIDKQVCWKPNDMMDPPCPSGTSAGADCCEYSDGTPVPMFLGANGHMDLGQFLSGISPSTKGGLDFLFAAGGEGGTPPYGNLNPVGSGATLGLYGGALPQPVSSCVKAANMDPPKGIPIPNELYENSISNWGGSTPNPHLGIALSEEFFNYALAGVYDSGLLCLGITGDSLGGVAAGGFDLGSLLKTDGLKLLGLGSVKDLGGLDDAGPIAFSIRPSIPPTATFGNGTGEDDPHINLDLKQMNIDWYAWSQDRYMRFLTLTYDINVKLSLDQTPEGLVPNLQAVALTNGVASHVALIKPEEADTVAAGLGELLGGVIPSGPLGSPIDLNGSLASLGLTLEIPAGGIRKLTKDATHNYLGIFAALGVAPPAPPPTSKTSAEIVSKSIDPKALVLATATRENVPEVALKLGSSLDNGAEAVEYQIRLNSGFWRPWSQKRFLDLREPAFRLQGKHKIEVRSRVVGKPETMDPEPIALELRVDASAPVVQAKVTPEGFVNLNVRDFVSEPEATLVRYRLDDAAWTDWVSADTLTQIDAGNASEVTVEAKDEEGLVGTATAALRGKAIAGDGGCGCSVAGSDRRDSSPFWLAGAALALGVALRASRRNRKSVAKATESTDATEASETEEASITPASRSILSSKIVRRTLGTVALMAASGAWAGCNCGAPPETGAGGHGGDGGGGSAPICDTCEPLLPGVIGAYTSVAVTGETLWIAGYLEAGTYDYGDLVVGKYNGQQVDWDVIDGLPLDETVDPKLHDPDGFRKGLTEEGDNVGFWTSIAVNDAGDPAIAYYDRTNRALKFAQFDGKQWTAHTVQQKAKSDLGKYAKMLWQNGAWHIAFLAMEPGTGGAVSSGVRVAHATSASPSEGGWTFEDVISNPTTPCRARFCDTGTTCVKATGLCTAEGSGCDPACAAGEACFDVNGSPACQGIFKASDVEAYPDATGGYIAIAPEKGGSGFGLVFYDRVKGNLHMASHASGSWVTTILDGETGGNDTGDVGIGASLSIDDTGNWHIAYSDGTNEVVKYMQVVNGVASSPETVDDGAGIEGTPFDDGRHIVGDDASIHVTSTGEVHISYQDATAGILRYAVGTPNASGHSWALKEIAQPGLVAGSFSKVVTVGTDLQIVNFWRTRGKAFIEGDVSVMTP